MSQAHVHLAYAPRGVGLLYATLWLPTANDVVGWFIGDVAGQPLAAYFKLENHYAAGQPNFLRSVQDDMQGPWAEATLAGEVPVPHAPPVDEAMAHELVRLQDQFIRHWLFFGDDPAARPQAQAYAARELAVRTVNVRPDRLGKFRADAAVCSYDAPGADTNVLVALARRWPLDYRVGG